MQNVLRALVLLHASASGAALLLKPAAYVRQLPPTAYVRHRPAYLQYATGDSTRGLESLNTTEQQAAFRSVIESEQFSATALVTADTALWDRVRAFSPDLADLSDDQLQDVFTSYINTPPSVSDILLKTPVGPVILINLLFFATGFTWCDIPFLSSDTQACAELAARAT